MDIFYPHYYHHKQPTQQHSIFIYYYFFSLLLLLIAATEDVLVCNSGSAIGSAYTASIYAKYPVLHTDECDNPAKQEAIYAAEIAACTLADAISLGIGLGACSAVVTKLRFDRLQRCEDLARRLADQAANLNARIPASDAPFNSVASPAEATERYYADYSVEIIPNAPGTNFGTRNSRSVIWYFKYIYI